MLEKYDVYLRPFNCQRTLHIYLPNVIIKVMKDIQLFICLMDIICF